MPDGYDSHFEILIAPGVFPLGIQSADSSGKPSRCFLWEIFREFPLWIPPVDSSETFIEKALKGLLEEFGKEFLEEWKLRHCSRCDMRTDIQLDHAKGVGSDSWTVHELFVRYTDLSTVVY